MAEEGGRSPFTKEWPGGVFKRVYGFPQRGSWHGDVRVAFIEISQPTGNSIDDTAIVAIRSD
jgi:hypothetical protein